MAFSLAGSGLIFGILVWGANSMSLFVYKVYGTWDTVVLVAIPLFIMMGAVLERSGIAEDLYRLMYGTIGRLRGGLAMGTVLICTIFAAMTGISGAATVSMGLIALPSMLKRKYSKTLAVGSIAAGGALGILIPPSVDMIIFALYARESVGRLFAGGVFPGLLLSSLFLIYIGIRAHFQPQLAPVVEPAERFNLKQSLSFSRALILPFLIVALVLGAIFSGAATPTEAAATGALGAIIAALVRGRFTFSLFREALYTTFKLNAMLFWIIIGALLFTSVYIAIGAPDLVKELVMGMPVSRWIVIILMQLSIFVMGCFLDPLGILMITTPIYVPVIVALGFDKVWYGVLFIMNMEMAYLTPPFGINLFYMKSIVPPEVTIADIYRSIVPFVGIQAVGLAIVMVFPQIALFLPNLIFGS